MVYQTRGRYCPIDLDSTVSSSRAKTFVYIYVNDTLLGRFFSTCIENSQALILLSIRVGAILGDSKGNNTKDWGYGTFSTGNRELAVSIAPQPTLIHASKDAV